MMEDSNDIIKWVNENEGWSTIIDEELGTSKTTTSSSKVSKIFKGSQALVIISKEWRGTLE